MSEIVNFLGKTLTFKKFPEMNGYYQLSCGNEVLVYYFRAVTVIMPKQILNQLLLRMMIIKPKKLQY